MLNALDEIAAAFWDGFQFMALQNAFFLAVVLAILFLLRNKSLKLQSLVAFLGLIKLLVPPLLYVNSPHSADIALVEVNQAVTAMISASPVEDVLQLSGATVLSLLWLTVAVAIFGISLVRTYLLWREFSRGSQINVDALVSGAAQRNVRVAKSCKSHSPLVFGLTKQWILLPREWDSWEISCRKAVLAHELAHVEHRDHWLSLLQLLVRSLYFFNPLVAILNRKLSEYREIACDDSAVATLRISPIEYTKQLVQISETVVQRRMGGLAATTFIRSRASIESRVAHQLSGKGAVGVKAGLVHRLAAVVLVMMFLPFSWHYKKPMLASVAVSEVVNGVTVSPPGVIHIPSQSTDAVCVTHDENGKPVDTIKRAPFRFTNKKQMLKPSVRRLAQLPTLATDL